MQIQALLFIVNVIPISWHMVRQMINNPSQCTLRIARHIATWCLAVWWTLSPPYQEIPVKFKNDTIIIASNIAASKLREFDDKTSYRLVNRCPGIPSGMLRKVNLQENGQTALRVKIFYLHLYHLARLLSLEIMLSDGLYVKEVAYICNSPNVWISILKYDPYIHTQTFFSIYITLLGIIYVSIHTNIHCWRTGDTAVMSQDTDMPRIFLRFNSFIIIAISINIILQQFLCQ